jgi:Skp family chaperone for outer membrane proteins
MPQAMRQQRLDNGGDFYCPNGHGQRYTKPRCERLESELATKQKELTAARCESLAERQKREQAEAELQRHKTRTKNGVCPCCNRSFINLRRHMASKHPSFR